jgi:hypothetical protein
MKPTPGPDDNDLFRFTWHNTPNEARVWIDYRGKWREGVIIQRGRRTVTVAFNGHWVRRPYETLRRRR